MDNACLRIGWLTRPLGSYYQHVYDEIGAFWWNQNSWQKQISKTNFRNGKAFQRNNYLIIKLKHQIFRYSHTHTYTTCNFLFLVLIIPEMCNCSMLNSFYTFHFGPLSNRRKFFYGENFTIHGKAKCACMYVKKYYSILLDIDNDDEYMYI